MDAEQTDCPQPATAPQLYSVDHAAEILDVDPRTVWRLIRSGKLSRVRVTRVTRVRADELAALVEARTERTG